MKRGRPGAVSCRALPHGPWFHLHRTAYDSTSHKPTSEYIHEAICGSVSGGGAVWVAVCFLTT